MKTYDIDEVIVSLESDLNNPNMKWEDGEDERDFTQQLVNWLWELKKYRAMRTTIQNDITAWRSHYDL